MEMISYYIRRVADGDAGTVARHRVSMFRDMGDVPTDALASMLLEASTIALDALLREGSYVGWCAVGEGDRVLAGAGVHIKPQLPRISHHGITITTAPVPLVVNVYSEPDVRGKGLARALMKTLMEWAPAQGFDRVVRHASDFGRPLYNSLGFVPTNEMGWFPSARGHSGQ
jgi:GNAT superfamily N-acetyltransferase